MVFVQGDSGFDINFAVVYDDGTAFDLTGATIAFKMYKPGAATSKISAAASIVSAGGGTCKYTVQSTDLSEAGRFKAELQITIGSVVRTALLDEIVIKEQAP